MIRRLELDNFMRVTSLVWEPKEGMNILRGKNRQGKTTIVKWSIDSLFGGADGAPPVPIKVGEETSRILADEDEFTATRRWWRTAEGVKTELKVVSKVDGKEIKKPQALFDKIFPPEADPTMFFRLKPAERVDWLLKVIGVDPTLLDKKIDAVFKGRTDVNRDLAQAEARLKAMPNEKPPPAIDTSALLKERGELSNAQQWEKQTKVERDAAMRRIADCQNAVQVAEQALAQAKVRLETAMKQAAEADNAADDAEEKASGAAARLAELDAQLLKASAVSAAHARWAEREKLVAEVQRLDADSTAKTAEIEKLREEKKKILDGVKLPIEGIGFGNGDVTYNDLPLEQASGAEQIRIGAALLVAKHPKMKLFRVPQGSNLDEENLAALDAFAEEHGIQTFLEAVGESGPATLIIRDGKAFEP
jgi:hypothetical protein